MTAAMCLLSTALGLLAARQAEPPADPFARNACVLCHRDLAGRSSEIVELEWKHSVHYANSVGCDGCHGGNAAVLREQFDDDDAWKAAAHLERNAEFLAVGSQADRFITGTRGRSISYFCGRCHALIKEKHLGSPHGDFGDPSCLYCHGQGSHAILPASLDIIDTRPRLENGRCSVCHQQSTMNAVVSIRKMLDEASQLIDASGREYRELEEAGYHNIELESMHHHSGEVHAQLRRVFHSFNMREIGDFAGEIRSIADRTARTHELVSRLREAQNRQSLVGLFGAAFLIAFACVLLHYKRRFCDAPHEAVAPP